MVISVPCNFDNYAYLLFDSTTQEALVIDPSEGYPVLVAAEQNGLTLTGILCTHHHRDHIGGIEELLEEHPGLPVYGYGGDSHRIPGLDRELSHGDTLQFAGMTGTVLHTPGHTTGSICYHFPHLLFSGDTLFGAGCGRLFEGNAVQMYNSLVKVLGSLPVETRVYCGHEYTEHNLRFAETIEPGNGEIARRLTEVRRLRADNLPTMGFTLAEERQTNPFLRCSEPTVQTIFPGLRDEVELFAEIRTRRNNF